MTKKQNYTWTQFGHDAKCIARMLKNRRETFDGVWGPARGGLPLAVAMSHFLNIPFCKKPKSRKTLIVDDIADTGKTLLKYAETHTIATLFYHTQSVFEPNIWLRKKTNKWIVFPWENI